MFNKNLKYYRLKNELTMSQLADRTGLSKMAISYYEKGERTPDMSTLKKLAVALNIKVMDFMILRNEKLQFQHGEFRKNTRLNKGKQEYMREDIEEYFNRFYNIVDILGESSLPKAPKMSVLKLSIDEEENARELRKLLKLSLEGPIGNLVNIVENNGILIYQHKVEVDSYSGMNGSINGRSYISININMNPERQRFTIAHELAHIFFKWPVELSEVECEKRANSIAGSFLLPVGDVYRELGFSRKAFRADIEITAEEYGVSVMCLAYRSKELKVVSDTIYKNFIIYISRLGWRKNEPSRINQEESNLFRQFVFRAIAEDEINIQKGAELLNTSFESIQSNMFSGGHL